MGILPLHMGNLLSKLASHVKLRSMLLLARRKPSAKVLRQYGTCVDAAASRSCWLENALSRLVRQENQVDTYASLLRRCGAGRALADGLRVHEHLVSNGYARSGYLGNLLVQMYSKCGRMDLARQAFDAIRLKNVFTWSIVISCYVHHGQCREALEVYRKIDVVPDDFIYASILGAAAGVGNLEAGTEIHASIVASGIQPNYVVQNALVNMYVKCGSVSDARRLFEQMPVRNVVSWTALIGAYAQQQQAPDAREAIELYHRMNLEADAEPDEITYAAVLAACSSLGELAEGRGVHARAEGTFPSVMVETALISFYAKCSAIDEAERVFEKMQSRDVMAWNAMIAAFAQNGHCSKALELYKRMDSEGIALDAFTFSNAITACSAMGAFEDGKAIHARMGKSRIRPDAAVHNALLHMYAKHGDRLDEARSLFDKMPHRNVVAWNAMIGAYAARGQGREALDLYQKMSSEGVQPNGITFSSLLAACSSLEELEAIQEQIIGSSFRSTVTLETALVAVYARCGSVLQARRAFKEMHKRDTVSWSAMIGAYAHHGHYTEALELFQDMKLEGFLPDSVTLVNVIHCCSHAGSLADGLLHFRRMLEDHGLNPVLDHYVCMVDLLGRAGRLESAEELIDSMPFQPDGVIWMTLLSACKTHGDAKRAARAAEWVARLAPEHGAPYVLLSSILGEAGEEEAASIQPMDQTRASAAAVRLALAAKT